MNNIMNLVKTFDGLCTPAQIYLGISLITFLGILSQNYNSNDTYTVGTYKVHLQHSNMMYFVFKFMYIITWTFILQRLCRSGYKNISWFLVLLPYILGAVLIGIFLLMNVKHPGNRGYVNLESKVL